MLTVLLGPRLPAGGHRRQPGGLQRPGRRLAGRDGTAQVVGSSLLGQNFTEPTYFHPRPSAAGDGYDPLASGGSNLGPVQPEAARRGRGTGGRRTGRRTAWPPTPTVPVDAVTASASGLDPQISVANARLQAARVAEARGVPVDEVLRLVDEHTQAPPVGLPRREWRERADLNLALDEMS